MSQPASSRFRTAGIILAAAVTAAVLLMVALQRHALAKEAARRRSDVEAGPRVHTVLAGAQDGSAALTFQGEAMPGASATLYAKLGGFLKEIRVDKGSRVSKGQILAVLESPETDKQTQGLKASYENIQRNADKITALGRQGIVSPVDVDNAQSSARVARQTWLSQADVAGYQRLKAPFDGVVTQRFVDPGAFVQNATGTQSAQPIVTVANLTRLRVAFFLDQASAGLAKVGQEVEVSPADHPDVVAKARISRLAGALDVRTRTMLAEVDLDNRDGRFMGGGTVRVTLALPHDAQGLDLPSEALLMRRDQAFAAVVEGGRIHLLPLVLGGDAGTRVRILKGLQRGQRVVLNPSPALCDGDAVQVAE